MSYLGVHRNNKLRTRINLSKSISGGEVNRILGYARWEDIWRYLTIQDIQENFEHLRFRLSFA